jgi:hypothetical protein
VESQVNPDKDHGRALLKVILELIAMDLCVTITDVLNYCTFTLMCQENLSDSHSAVNIMSSPPTQTIPLPTLKSVVQSLIFLITANAINLPDDMTLYRDLAQSDLRTGCNLMTTVHLPGNSNPSGPNDLSLKKTMSYHPKMKSLTHSREIKYVDFDKIDFIYNQNIPITITRFGRALVQSGINPDDGEDQISILLALPLSVFNSFACASCHR